MRISDWSSDVCSSDLHEDAGHFAVVLDLDGRGVYQATQMGLVIIIANLNLDLPFHRNADMSSQLDLFIVLSFGVSSQNKLVGGQGQYLENGHRVMELSFRQAMNRPRSEERRVGKECVSTGRLGGAPDH